MSLHSSKNSLQCIERRLLTSVKIYFNFKCPFVKMDICLVNNNIKVDLPEDHVVGDGEDGGDPGADAAIHLAPVRHGVHRVRLTLHT